MAAEEARGGTALVLTNDRDLFQLASQKTTVLQPRRAASELDRVGPDEVSEIYGVDPEHVPDFVALRGDPSDRIPGRQGSARAVPRASCQVRLAGSLPQAGGFPDQADALRDYLKITTLQADAEVPDMPDTEPDWDAGSALAKSWGLANLAKRMREKAEA